MFDIDFNGLYEQFGNKYAEIQKAVTRWKTTSETIQMGDYAFVVTTLPVSESFWSSQKKVLVSLEPLEDVSSPVALAFKDRWIVAKLLKQNPALLNTVLQLIDSIDFHCLTPHDLGTLKQLDRIYSHWKTPKELKESLREHTVTEILQHQNTLKSVFAYMDSINPAHLQKKNKWAMKRLSKIANNPQTPLTIKETILRKIYAITKEIGNRALELIFAIPRSVTDKTTGEGSYTVDRAASHKNFLALVDEINYCARKEHSQKGISFDIQQNGDFLYCDVPLDLKPLDLGNDTFTQNLLIIFNSKINQTLEDKSFEETTNRIVQIRKQLEHSTSKEQVYELAREIATIEASAAVRLPTIDQIRMEGEILNSFDLPKNDELYRVFTGRRVGATQAIGYVKLFRERFDKELSRCKAALEKAQAKIAESKLMRGAYRHTTATRFAR